METPYRSLGMGRGPALALLQPARLFAAQHRGDLQRDRIRNGGFRRLVVIMNAWLAWYLGGSLFDKSPLSPTQRSVPGEVGEAVVLRAMKLVQILGTGCPKRFEVEKKRGGSRETCRHGKPSSKKSPTSNHFFGVMMTPALAIDGGSGVLRQGAAVARKSKSCWCELDFSHWSPSNT